MGEYKNQDKTNEAEQQDEKGAFGQFDKTQQEQGEFDKEQGDKAEKDAFAEEKGDKTL